MLSSRTLFSILITLFQFGLCSQLLAQENSIKSAASIKIAVLNLEAIRRNANVIQGINKQIFGLEKEIKEALKSEEDTLRLANQDLAKKRAILAPDAYTLERKKFEQSVLKVQGMVQTKKQLLNRAKRTALAKVEATLNKIVANLAAEKGFLIVLRTDQTVLASRKLDITAVILDRLNKNLSSIVVEIPKK